MLHLYHYGETYPSAIAKDYDIAITPILHQLKKFESEGILASKKAGRTRLYLLNPKNPYFGPLKELIGITYNAIPLKEREKLFRKHRKPRRSEKPIL